MAICILFYFLREVLVVGKVNWTSVKPIAHHMSDYMINIGDMNAQDDSLTTLFAIFERKMNERKIIPRSVVKRYIKDLKFLVSTDFCIMESIEPRTIWVTKLDYEVSKAKSIGYAKVLLSSPKDPSKPRIMDRTRADMSATKTFGSSRRLGEKRKFTDSPPIAKRVKQEASRQKEININIVEE